MKIKIMRDKCPFNPRKEFDQTFVWYINPNRYISGDEVLDDSSNIWGSDKIRLPIYAYIHGDVVLSTAPFSCLWDSGTIGYAVTGKTEFLKRFCGEKAKVLTKHRRELARSVLQAEIEEFNAYICGDVWGYIITDDEGNEVDSCWGYHGRSAIEAVVDQLVEDEGYERYDED